MKQNVSETESYWCFQKKKKKLIKCLQNKKVSDGTFKAWPFSSDFDCKYGVNMVELPQQYANIAEFLNSSLKTSVCTKNSPVVWKPVFFLIIS